MSHASYPETAHPRTAEEPMAFTDGELVRGLITTGITFVVAVPLVFGSIVMATSSANEWMLSLYIVAVASFVFIAPVTLVLLVLATPLARRIGHALRRERRRWPHLLAFAALGAVLCIVGSVLVGFTMWATNSGLASPNPIPVTATVGAMAAPLAAGSAAFGWWRTSRRALAADAARVVEQG